jgi:hypothetical protein
MIAQLTLAGGHPRHELAGAHPFYRLQNWSPAMFQPCNSCLDEVALSNCEPRSRTADPTKGSALKSGMNVAGCLRSWPAGGRSVTFMLVDSARKQGQPGFTGTSLFQDGAL